MSDFHDQFSRKTGRPAETRRLGHDLKHILAAGLAAAERLRVHAIVGASVERDLADLRRAFAEAEEIADALLSEPGNPQR